MTDLSSKGTGYEIGSAITTPAGEAIIEEALYWYPAKYISFEPGETSHAPDAIIVKFQYPVKDEIVAFKLPAVGGMILMDHIELTTETEFRVSIPAEQFFTTKTTAAGARALPSVREFAEAGGDFYIANDIVIDRRHMGDLMMRVSDTLRLWHNNTAQQFNDSLPNVGLQVVKTFIHFKPAAIYQTGYSLKYDGKYDEE
jgi:hypothetical protein